jgi:hypothetical protein
MNKSQTAAATAENDCNKLMEQEGQTPTAATENDCGISDESVSRLEQKLRDMGSIDHKIIRDSSLEKMSDILSDYASPFLDTIDADNKKEYKKKYEKAIMLSMILWNCSLMEDAPEGRKEARKLLKSIVSDAESKSVIQYMLERKRQMYPDNKRMIMSYEVTEMPYGGLHYVRSVNSR